MMVIYYLEVIKKLILKIDLFELIQRGPLWNYCRGIIEGCRGIFKGGWGIFEGDRGIFNYGRARGGVPAASEDATALPEG